MLAVLGKLALTHAVDLFHILQLAGRFGAHVHQGLVAKHQVGRQLFGLGQPHAQGAQLLEQIGAVAGQGGFALLRRLAGLVLFGRCFGRFRLGRQLDHHLRPLLQRRDVAHVQHGVLVVGLDKVALLQQLGQQAVQFVPRAVLQLAVTAVIHRAQLPQAGHVGAAQGVQYHALAIAAAGLGYAVDHPLGLGGHVHLLKLAVAVAAAAAGFGGFLAKIVQDVVAQAAGGLAVVGHGLQALVIPRPQQVGGLVVQVVILLAVQQKAVDDDVLGREQQNALGRQPVAPGTACLLVVVLHALGHVVMDDVPHVGFVDAHTEGVGGHNDRRGIVDEVVLALAAFLVGHARVVAGGGNVLAPQHFLHGIDVFAGGAVDDAALAGVAAHIVRHKGVLAASSLDPVVEVGAVKPGNDDFRVAQTQRLGNVVLDLAGGGGRKRTDDGPPGQAVDEVQDAQVAGAEILPPLADAVGLVHRQHGDFGRRGKALEGGAFQPFRRDVDDLVAALGCQL